MSVLRKLMIRAGYSVSERSAHIGRAWDWDSPGKGPMDSRHFKSETEAWEDAERAFRDEVRRARVVMDILAAYVVHDI